MRKTRKMAVIFIVSIAFGSLIWEANATLITNDGYPAVGGVSWVGAGSPGSGTGATWTYSSFDFSAFDQLWYGFNASILPEPLVSMNNNSGWAASANLSFSSIDSSLASGIAVWTGASDFTTVTPAATTSIPVRFTASLQGPGATQFVLSNTLLTIDPTFDTSQSVVTEVIGDFSVNFLAEGFYGGTWTPINDLFDGQDTASGDQTNANFSTGFYSTAATAVPEPSSALMLGLTCLTLTFRRCRRQLNSQFS